jgi:protein phosphatase 2C family protein 2/3
VLFLSLVGMEDAHTTIPEYKDTKTSFFAVFDGHGGK